MTKFKNNITKSIDNLNILDRDLHLVYGDELETNIDNMLENNIDTKSGSNLTYNNTIDSGKLDFDIIGNIESGSTSSEYEPYKTVTGDNDVVINNKQLFNNQANYDYTNAEGTWTLTPLDTGLRISTTNISSTSSSYMVFVLKDLKNYVGKTVRIKSNFNIVGKRKALFALGLCNADSSNRTRKTPASVSSGGTYSFEIPELIGDQTYLYIILYCYGDVGSTTNDYIDYTNLIITIDNSDMSYEPYRKQTYTLHLGDLKLPLNYKIKKINDIWNIETNDTLIPITDTTLIADLDALYNDAITYQDQTNITTVSDSENAQMLIDASVFVTEKEV